MEKKNLHLKKEEINILPYKKEIKITGGRSGVEAPLKPLQGFSNNRIEIVKKIMKEKGLTLPQASKFVKENNLYQKIEKAVGAGNKSGKISRIKKAKKWRDFSNETLKDGIDTASYGYKEYQKAVNPITSKVKSIFGGNAKKSPSKWIMFVKEYASKNGISYKEALKTAGPEYRKLKEN